MPTKLHKSTIKGSVSGQCSLKKARSCLNLRAGKNFIYQAFSYRICDIAYSRPA